MFDNLNTKLLGSQFNLSRYFNSVKKFKENYINEQTLLSKNELRSKQVSSFTRIIFLNLVTPLKEPTFVNFVNLFKFHLKKPDLYVLGSKSIIPSILIPSSLRKFQSFLCRFLAFSYLLMTDWGTFNYFLFHGFLFQRQILLDLSKWEIICLLLETWQSQKNLKRLASIVNLVMIQSTLSV